MKRSRLWLGLAAILDLALFPLLYFTLGRAMGYAIVVPLLAAALLRGQ